MHRVESEHETCFTCGDEYDPLVDLGFALGHGLTVCHACALDRGGVYSYLKDRWIVAPDVPVPREAAGF